jgi:hypothetical protein
MAGSHRGREEAAPLSRLAAEIAQDRSALLDIMASLGVTVQMYKIGAAWLGEKAGRLRFNGRLLARSPLSDLGALSAAFPPGTWLANASPLLPLPPVSRSMRQLAPPLGVRR